MSGTEFVKLTEKNDLEGETWYHWLQYTGNEVELGKLDALFDQWQDDSPEELEYKLDLDVRATEDKVDFVVEHGGWGYMNYHNKHTGTFTCPEDPGLDEVTEEWEDPHVLRDDLFYKGGIREYFHE